MQKDSPDKMAMTRPSIVRADTIDLQDTDAPHAAERTKPQSTNSIAPHQALQYQHVAEERHTEEQALVDAWNMAGNATGEHGAGDHADEDKTTSDGAHVENGGDDGDGDGADQDADDDLMDRISSSPSIDGGYLPAEHIETPTERQARYNKHRNIDLSQSMLGDNPEKSRNPLRIAMRRRNAKTVQFAAPTYVEASDYDYSDDEDQPTADPYTNGTPQEDVATNGQPAEVEERHAPEEANVHATRRFSGEQQLGTPSKSSVESSRKSSFDSIVGEDPQLSPKLVDRSEAAPLKSRKGTPRNTDSFLKDDNNETRKITLTPGLLREDGNAASSKGSSIESQRNNSMESLTKTTSPDASSGSSKKESKDKKKDKKQGGMLSGLFKSKKKDKKSSKDDDAVQSDTEKNSMELSRGGSPLMGGPSGVTDQKGVGSVAAASAAGRDVLVQSRGGTPIKQQSTPVVAAPAGRQAPVADARRPKGAFTAELQGSEAAFEMEGNAPDTQAQTKAVPIMTNEEQVQPGDRDSPLSPVTNLLKHAPKAKRSKQRVELDDFDTPPEDVNANPMGEQWASERADAGTSVSGDRSASRTFMHGTEIVHIPMTFGDVDDNDNDDDDDDEDDEDEADVFKDAESERRVDDDDDETEGGKKIDEFVKSAPHPASINTTQATAVVPPSRPAPSHPPARENSTSSASSSSGPEAETPKSASPTSTISKQKWDDGALRAWLDAEEVKDMLTIVQSSARIGGIVEPVPNNHPLMQGLYVEERGAVGRMMNELDSLLMGYVGRKGLTSS